jgi:E3 ubiquitin-protein ligase makorin
MGDQSTSNNRFPYQCRYWRAGHCSRGAACLYSHDEDAPAENICRFYLAGTCRFGNSCRSLHERPARTMAAAASIQSTTSSASNQKDKARLSRPPSSLNEIATTSSALSDILCPYHMMGTCYMDSNCKMIHGDVCQLCNVNALHPTNQQQREEHKKECVQKHEMECNASFEYASEIKAKEDSVDKQCGICMDTVLEKENKRERQFGLLSSCSHVFCFECILQWRRSTTFDNSVKRSCPSCRTKSDFIIPSNIYADGELKTRLISRYKAKVGQTHCRYFKRGTGECMFGNQCFFKHEYPNGTIARGESPHTIRQRVYERNRNNPRTTYHNNTFLEPFFDWEDLYIDSDDEDMFDRGGYNYYYGYYMSDDDEPTFPQGHREMPDLWFEHYSPNDDSDENNIGWMTPPQLRIVGDTNNHRELTVEDVIQSSLMRQLARNANESDPNNDVARGIETILRNMDINSNRSNSREDPEYNEINQLLGNIINQQNANQRQQRTRRRTHTNRHRRQRNEASSGANEPAAQTPTSSSSSNRPRAHRRQRATTATVNTNVTPADLDNNQMEQQDGSSSISRLLATFRNQ